MKRIINPWIGNKNGYHCFGCDPNNKLGMRMQFYWDGEQVLSPWRAGGDHVSWIDTLHGGIQATLLDEICGWVVFYQLQTSGVTAKMEMRYRKQVDTRWPYILMKARLLEQRHTLATVKGEIWSPEGVLCAECTCTYFIYPTEKAVEMGYMPAKLGEEDITIEEAIALLGR
ncbi:MAG: PaaI family thioesterase [Bacteroidales bacterium]|nr:PaaI family thioesterase [Bacteroidales bacterium]